MQSVVAILENLSIGSLPLEDLAGEFGWSLERVFGLERLRSLALERIVAAVLFDPSDLNLAWKQALRSVREAAPGSLTILCHRFSEAIPWPELVEAGAFHSLRLPLDLHEVRQSFGFAWAANSRASINLMSVVGAAPRKSAAALVLAQAAGKVA